MLTPAFAAVVYMCIPQGEAKAAAPQGRGSGFDGGGYLTLTPGAFVLTGQHDFIDVDPSYGWGFGGGYMFAPGAIFKGTIGGTFEHNVLMIDDQKFKNFGAHVVRVMPELRLGLGNDAAWGYALIGAGVGSAMWNWNEDAHVFGGGSGKDMAVGFNVEVGAGVQAIVYKNFFLGGEVDFDAGFFRENNAGDWPNNDDSDFSMYQVSLELTMGWCF